MRKVGILVLSLTVVSLGSACGYLDDDLAKSDEEFAASLGMSGTGVSIGGYGYGSSSGCGVGGTSRVHGGRATTGHPHIRHQQYPTTLHLSPSYITASAGQGAAAGLRLAVAETDEQAPPIYAAGEIETWGEYLEAELQRARR